MNHLSLISTVTSLFRALEESESVAVRIIAYGLSEDEKDANYT